MVVVAVSTDNHLYHISQNKPNGGFSSNWQPIGGINVNGYPVVARNADDRLEVFAVGTDNHLYHMSQTKPNGAAELHQQQLQRLSVRSNNISTSTEENLQSLEQRIE